MIGIASGAILWLAGAVTLVGALGMLRFPDFYTRCHAATMVSVGGFSLALIGIALQATTWVFPAKILVIFAVNLAVNPTATHALADAAYAMGIKPAGLVKNELGRGRARGVPGRKK